MSVNKRRDRATHLGGMDRTLVGQLVHQYLKEAGLSLAALALADAAPTASQGDHPSGSLLEILDRHAETAVRLPGRGPLGCFCAASRRSLSSRGCRLEGIQLGTCRH